MRTMLLIFLTFCFTGVAAIAQAPGSGQTTSGTQAMSWDKRELSGFVHQMNKSIALGGEQIPVSDIEGSMYYQQEFIKGSLYLGNTFHKSFFLRYNAYLDQFEVKTGQGQLPRSVTKGKTLSFKLGEDTYVLLDYQDSKGQLFAGYLLELVPNGKYRLYQEKRKIFQRGKKAQTSFHKTSPHRFVDSQSFYVYSGRSYPKQLKNSNKSLKSLFGSNADRVKIYIKKNNIRLNDPKDLVQLVNFLNAGI